MTANGAAVKKEAREVVCHCSTLLPAGRAEARGLAPEDLGRPRRPNQK